MHVWYIWFILWFVPHVASWGKFGVISVTRKFSHILASLVVTAFRITHFCTTCREHYPEGNQGYNHLNMWEYVCLRVHNTQAYDHCTFLLAQRIAFYYSWDLHNGWNLINEYLHDSTRNIQHKGHNVLIMIDLTNLKMVEGKPEWPIYAHPYMYRYTYAYLLNFHAKSHSSVLKLVHKPVPFYILI